MIIVAESILDQGIEYFREPNLADWTKVDAHAYHVCEIPLTTSECVHVREVCLKYIADAGKVNLEDLIKNLEGTDMTDSGQKESFSVDWYFNDWESKWESVSVIHDGGDPFRWVIKVCKNGKFTTRFSDKELCGEVPPFDTLPAAQSFCASLEKSFIIEYGKI